MAEKITDEEMWEIIGYIKVSAIRMKILKSLKDSFLMPSEGRIYQNTELGLMILKVLDSD